MNNITSFKMAQHKRKRYLDKIHRNEIALCYRKMQE